MPGMRKAPFKVVKKSVQELKEKRRRVEGVGWVPVVSSL